MTTIEQHNLRNAPIERSPIFWKRFIDNFIFVLQHKLVNPQEDYRDLLLVHKLLLIRFYKCPIGFILLLRAKLVLGYLLVLYIFHPCMLRLAMQEFSGGASYYRVGW